MRSLLPRCALLAATALTAALMVPVAAQATDVDAARDEVRQLGEDVEAAAAEYNEVEARLEATRARVEAAQARIDSQAAVIADMEDQLADLAVETFKRGGVDPRLMLLSGPEFAQSSSTLSLIAERQSLSLTDLEQAQRDLERAEAAAAADLSDVESLEADLAQRRADIEERLDDAKDVLAVAEAEAKARAEAEERRRQEQASRSDRSSSVDTSTVTRTGAMATPVAGKLTSPFGYRVHPVYGDRRFHSGIDISNSCGTPVVAAENGVVESARWDGAYGYMVILQHGEGLSTAYAHLNGFAVSSGQVSKGQVIAYVGTTGLSTGCHLHFEVRRGGQAVDPLGFI